MRTLTLWALTVVSAGMFLFVGVLKWIGVDMEVQLFAAIGRRLHDQGELARKDLFADSAGQFIHEVDLGAFQERQGKLIHQHGRAVLIDPEVVGLRALHQVEAVLEARTAAAVHRDAQHHRSPLGLAEGVDPPSGGTGDGDVGGAHAC